MMDIISVKAIEILDSRGNPTIRSYVTLDDGTIGSASVPSGASTGSHEALELRDKDEHYLGKGVEHAVYNVNNVIADELIGADIDELEKIDDILIGLDPTKDKSVLGANAILSVSLACARTFAAYQNEPLWKALNDYYFPHAQTHFPRLMVNVINGGQHGNWVTDIQEFMISPVEHTPSTAIEVAANIFHTLQQELKEKEMSIAVGDEGGFSPTLETNEQAFEMLDGAIQKAGYSREEIDIATDVAASEFYMNKSYEINRTSAGSRFMNADEFTEYLLKLRESYSVLSFEDPFAEDDWDAFARFTDMIGKTSLVVGDDLYVTNPDRIQKGIDMHATNAVLIKVNQIGTLHETVQAITMARDAGWKIIISHRSGETGDSFISDLAVACGADFIKAGSMSRSERLAKYNRLLEIEKIEY